MFSLILLFCLTFTIPLGKLFDIFYWNNQIIPLETTQSVKENSHSTLQLSAKHFKVVQSLKSDYFFQIKLIPLLENCLFAVISLTFINQKILFSEQHKDSIYKHVFNVFYPSEKIV